MARTSLVDALDLGQIYAQATWAVDGLIYTVLFLGLAQVSIGRRFNGRGGRAVVLAVGFALAIGSVTLAQRSGFTLAALGGPAWILILIVAGLMLHDLMRTMGAAPLPAVGLSLIVVGALARVLGEPLREWVDLAGLGSLFPIGAGFAFLAFIWWMLGKLPRRIRSPVRALNRTVKTRSQSQMVDSIDSAARIEVSLIQLLQHLREHVRSEGTSAKTLALLQEIKRRTRFVQLSYERALRLGHDERAARLLSDARLNIRAFQRALEVAFTAQTSSKRALLDQAVAQMLGLEERAIELTEAIRDAATRLPRQQAERRSGNANGPRQ